MLDLGSDIAHALDGCAFAEDRLGFRPDAWQAQLMRSTSRQLVLNCSRQVGKSTVTAAIATHEAIYRPGALVLLFSKAQRQSRELFFKVISYIKALQPLVELSEDNKLSCTLQNGSRIVSLPGDGDTVRGYSAANLVIEDEAGFVSDALYTAIRPMLAVSQGRLILLSTPNGRQGHFYKVWSEGGDDWERVQISADECPRIPTEFLEAELRALGPMLFSQEYGCQFIDPNTSAFSSILIEQALSDAFKPFL